MVVARSCKNRDQTQDLDSAAVNPLRPQRTKGCLYSFLGDLQEASPAGLVGLLAYSTYQRGLHGGPAPSEQGPSLREGRYPAPVYSLTGLYLWPQDPAKCEQLTSSHQLSETNDSGLCL